MKRGMPSGAQTPDGIIFLLALIFSKALRDIPPHHGAHWAYTDQTTLLLLNIFIGYIQVTSCRGQRPPAEDSLNFAECIVAADNQLVSPVFLESQKTNFFLQSA